MAFVENYNRFIFAPSFCAAAAAAAARGNVKAIYIY